MPTIVRNYGVGLACNGQFEKELIAGVGQEGPQPEVNIRLAAHEAKRLDYSLRRALRGLHALALTLCNSLILEN